MAHVFMFVVGTVWGLWECWLCSGRCWRSWFYSFEVLKYVVCLCKGCDGCCVLCFIVRREAVGARVWKVLVFRHAHVVCLCLVFSRPYQWGHDLPQSPSSSTWCCQTTPLTLASGGGVRSSRSMSTSQLLRPSGQQFRHSSGVCPQVQRWQHGAYVGEVEEMMCIVCGGVTGGHRGDGCDWKRPTPEPISWPRCS